MASIIELLHTEQAKSQCCPVEQNTGASAGKELQRALNSANAANLSHTVESFITNSMIANTAGKPQF